MKVQEEHPVHTGLAPSNIEKLRVRVAYEGWSESRRVMKAHEEPRDNAVLATSNMETPGLRVEAQTVKERRRTMKVHEDTGPHRPCPEQH